VVTVTDVVEMSRGKCIDRWGGG